MSTASSQITDRQQLKRLAHALRPIVTVAERGLTESVVQELNRALHDHELIKIKVSVADRDLRAALIAEAAGSCGAALVSSTGKTAVLYRANPRANPKLSNLQRTAAKR